MKKFIYAIFAFAVLAFVGCTKEEIDDVTVQPGEAISFGVMTEGTRTVYGSQNTTDYTWPIYWTSTDQIRIFSAQAQSTQSTAAGVAYADYKVNGDGTASKATIAAVDTNKALKWNSEYGVQHTFYATYPGANNNITVDANGIATFPINRNQICDRDATDKSATYVFKPRMENQYMVATAGENPKNLPDSVVWLDFKPVMTTLDIIVQGQNNDDDNANVATSKKITGVSIIMEYNNIAAVNASTFAYNIASGSITAGDSSTDTTTNTTSNTFFIGVENGDIDAVELAPDETLKLTAFLPPVQGVDYTMKVRVHATGTTELIATLATATAEGGAIINGTATKLTPSSKVIFTLPEIPNPMPEGNDWITPLADDIYVSQMSIPGVHDACTDDLEAKAGNIGQTQALSITDMLEMGIRVFDLRPIVTGESTDISLGDIGYKSLKTATGFGDICHGMVKTKDTMESVFNEFDAYLSEHEGEFIIAIVRNESTDYYTATSLGGLNNGLSADQIKAEFNTRMQSFLNTNAVYTKRKVDFKNDLTIGDMRKDGVGRILVLCRDDAAVNGAAYIQWGHGQRAIEDGIKTMAGTKTLYVQDMFSNGEIYGGVTYDDKYYNDGSNYKSAKGMGAETRDWATVKPEAVMRVLNFSAKLHTENGYDNIWVINHCSGYSGLNNYASSASVVNKPVYEYLVGLSKSFVKDFPTKTTQLYTRSGNIITGYNYSESGTGTYYNHPAATTTPQTKAVGSTGIMMLDFVGAHTQTYLSTTYTTYGDLLPQTIIDNNYKYTMKRKTN